jgi:multidrug efflux pump subunit AcrA (membrane-fusion protein)
MKLSQAPIPTETALSAILLLSLVACSPSATSAPPPQAATAPIQVTAVPQPISSAGQISAPMQVTVQPQASGRVQQVLVTVGSQVHTGDVLAQLEGDSEQLALAQARANLDMAQAKLQTVQAGARPADVAQAQEELAQQQAKLAGMLAQGRPENVAAAQAGFAALSSNWPN